MGLCAAGLAAAGLYRLDGWRLAELLVLLGIGALLLINPVVPINWSSRHRPAARQTPDHHS